MLLLLISLLLVKDQLLQQPNSSSFLMLLQYPIHLMQAMTINARVHSLQLQLPDGSSQPVASVLRSGGFATHGRKPRRMGLAALKEMADYCQLREVSNQ